MKSSKWPPVRFGFLVVGFQSILCGARSATYAVQQEVAVEVELPASAIAEGVSHGGITLSAESIDPKVSYRSNRGESTLISSNMEGEQIFAVQYRLLEFKEKEAVLRHLVHPDDKPPKRHLSFWPFKKQCYRLRETPNSQVRVA